MSEQSKSARAAMRAKAKRLTSGGGNGKVDASDYTQPTDMNASKKTGMRPVSPRTYKLGGRVQGDRGPRRGDKKPRGNVADEISTRDTKQANRDKFGSPHVGGMKKGGAAHDDAAEDKAMIKKMVRPSAMKRDAKCGGGAMGRADGGKAPDPKPSDSGQGYDPVAVNKEIAKDKRIGGKEAAQIHRLLKGRYKSGGSVAGGERPTGDRIPRADGGRNQASDNFKGGLSTKGLDWKKHPSGDGYAWYDGRKQMSGMFGDKADATKAAITLKERSARASGGRTKGKTNINIIVNPSKAQNDQPPVPGPVRPPPPPMPAAPPPPPPQGSPPGGPPPSMPPPSMMAGMGGPPSMRARGGRLGMNKIGGAGGGLGRLEKANMR